MISDAILGGAFVGHAARERDVFLHLVGHDSLLLFRMS